MSCAHTYLCVYISPSWETLLYAFFFFENKIFLLSLPPYLYVQNEKNTSSCLLFNGVAHLDNREVNLVRGQLLNPHWYFAAPPEAAEQRQCRFHPPCPTAIQGETVGSRHKAPSKSVAYMDSLFFLSTPTTEHLQNFFIYKSLRGNTQKVCALQCTNIDFALLPNQYLRPVFIWILPLCHHPQSCATSQTSSRKEQVTRANLLPKSHVLWGQPSGKKKKSVLLGTDRTWKGCHHPSDLGEEATISALSTFWKKQANDKRKPGCCCF